MVSRREFLVGSSVSGTLATSGCLATLPFGKPPVEDVQVRVIDVRGLSPGLTSITIPSIVEIRNTNRSDEVPAPSISYTAMVNGAEVGSSEVSIPDLGPEASVEEKFELIAEYADLGDGVANAIESGDLRLTFDCEITSEGVSAEISDTYEVVTK